jgi:DNA primase large subunit
LEKELFLTRSDLAKYPFTQQAAEHVQELGLGITELSSPEYVQTLNRAEKRIEEAILQAEISQQQSNEEIEILSFPIAVMMVSTTQDPFLKRRYALAEAKRAYKLLQQESRNKTAQIAANFNWKIKQARTEAADFALHFTDFLRNTTGFHEPKWKLVNRRVLNGDVLLTNDETARLLAEEVRAHVENRLSTKVGLELPQGIANRVERLQQLFLSKKGRMRQEEMPKEVVVDAFPPCIRELRNNALAGRHLSHVGRFALTSFLLNAGMTVENVIDCFRSASDFNERMTRYQAEHIAGGRGSRTKYIPPKCETLRTHGVCPGIDEICRRIRHPLAYYRTKVRIAKAQHAETATAPRA